MNNEAVNRTPYIRSSREFPEEEVDQLSFQLNLAYVDIANAVNVRTIGLFPTTRPAITGNSYYPTTQKQQSLRKIYTFTSSANIPHNIDFRDVDYFVAMYGQYTNSLDPLVQNWFGIIPATSNPITNQTTFYLTPTDIVLTFDGTAPTPAKGIIILEWMGFR